MESDEPTIMSPTCSKPLDKSQFIWENLGIWDPAFSLISSRMPSPGSGSWEVIEVPGHGSILRTELLQIRVAHRGQLLPGDGEGITLGICLGWKRPKSKHRTTKQQPLKLRMLILGWKSSAIFSASLLGMPRPSLHLAHSWFHHVS